MNRVLLASALFSALFLTACPGGGGGEPFIDVGELCSGDGLICNWSQDKLLKCENGTLILNEDCSASGKSCKGGACVTDEVVGGDCTGTGSACSGDRIVICTDGKWADSTDCAAQDKNCVEEEAGAVCKEKPVTDDAKPDDATTTEGEPTDDPGSEGEPADDTTAPDTDWGEVDPNGDEDGDGIPNGIEGTGDADMDGAPNYMDGDSDGDDLSDSQECPVQPCQNSDADTKPDFLDKDSDNDGLADIEEVGIGTDPYDKDTDDDNSDDLAEIVYGSNPKDPNSTIPAGLFFVVLPYNAPEDVTRNLMFSTDFSTVDIVVQLDLSGSMEQEKANLQAEIQEKIIDGIPQKVPGLDVATGFVHFMDMVNGDMFVVDHMISKDADSVKNAVANLPDTSGGTEPHQEVLYQTATGAGLVGKFVEAGGMMTVNLNIPAADCTGQMGTVGGVCFRELALKIFIMITDEAFPEIDVTGSGNCGISGSASDGCWDVNAKGALTEDAINAMNGINAKFIGIDSGFSCSDVDPNTYDCIGTYTEQNAAKEDFQIVAEGTASLDGNGNPFLYHTASWDGSGMSDQIAEAVKQLTTYIEKDITTSAESDENCDGISAADFVASSKPDKADPVDGFQSKDDTTFYKVKPSTEVYFDIHFHNDFCKNASPDPVIYKARIRVLGEGAFLSSREVQIIVPGSQAE